MNAYERFPEPREEDVLTIGAAGGIDSGGPLGCAVGLRCGVGLRCKCGGLLRRARSAANLVNRALTSLPLPSPPLLPPVPLFIAEPNKKELGKLFKKDAKAITDALEALSECERGGEEWGVWAGMQCGNRKLTCGISTPAMDPTPPHPTHQTPTPPHPHPCPRRRAGDAGQAGGGPGRAAQGRRPDL